MSNKNDSQSLDEFINLINKVLNDQEEDARKLIQEADEIIKFVLSYDVYLICDVKKALDLYYEANKKINCRDKIAKAERLLKKAIPDWEDGEILINVKEDGTRMKLPPRPKDRERERFLREVANPAAERINGYCEQLHKTEDIATRLSLFKKIDNDFPKANKDKIKYSIDESFIYKNIDRLEEALVLLNKANSFIKNAKSAKSDVEIVDNYKRAISCYEELEKYCKVSFNNKVKVCKIEIYNIGVGYWNKGVTYLKEARNCKDNNLLVMYQRAINEFKIANKIDVNVCSLEKLNSFIDEYNELVRKKESLYSKVDVVENENHSKDSDDYDSTDYDYESSNDNYEERDPELSEKEKEFRRVYDKAVEKYNEGFEILDKYDGSISYIYDVEDQLYMAKDYFEDAKRLFYSAGCMGVKSCSRDIRDCEENITEIGVLYKKLGNTYVEEADMVREMYYADDEDLPHKYYQLLDRAESCYDSANSLGCYSLLEKSRLRDRR